MRIIGTLFCFLVVVTLGRAAESVPFAPTGRFVSVVQYFGGAGPHWTVWAVQPGKLTIYTQSGRSDGSNKLLAEVTLSRDQEERIRKTASALSRKAGGKVWYTPDVMDGVALDVQFSADGSPRDGDALLENVWRPEFAELCESISALAPVGLQITFATMVQARPHQDQMKVVSLSVKEFRNR